MRFRGTTIRRKIVALLLIPLVALIASLALGVTMTSRQLFDRPDAHKLVDYVRDPTDEAISSLQQERRVAMIYVANPRDSQARIAYDKQAANTDAAIAKLRTGISSSNARGELDSAANDQLDGFLGSVEQLGPLRQRIDNQQIARSDTYSEYNELVAPALNLIGDLHPLDDSTRDSKRRAVADLDRAREELSRQDALIAAAISSGHISSAELTAFTMSVGAERAAYGTDLAILGTDGRAPYDEYWRGKSGTDLRSLQDKVIDGGTDSAPVIASTMSWSTVAGTAFDDLGRLNARAEAPYYTESQPGDSRVVFFAVLGSSLGLLVVIASLAFSYRVGRGLIRDLTGLRREAQEVSGTRLPRVMRRLAAGEQVDIETEVPRLHYPDDEIGQVGKALNTLQRAAVEAAVRQADVRKGVSDVFVNLARRSQVLLHRQLTLLDAMERRTENADELADLFRLDHMTTRMRRHAEGLVILSGAAPSRQWRKPVQLMDVVRAAIAEVEDYERIEVRRLPRLAVAGAAVADLTHLLAELIENAAVFSPPHTQVRLHGEPVANGFVLEVDDRGLGLTPDALLEANLRLAETPEFELSDTDRLGLFVVSRLAQRHSIRVSLRHSPYGGTTAVVLIPVGLLTETGDDTGTTRLGEAPAPRAPEPVNDTEHTFRQWGLDSVGGETHKEHAAHPDEPGGAPEEEAQPSGPMPLPRRRRGSPVLISDRGRQVRGAHAAPAGAPPAADGAAPQQAAPVQPLQPVEPVQPVRSARHADRQERGPAIGSASGSGASPVGGSPAGATPAGGAVL
ncbi:MAG: hypothetical protein QOF98_3241, partial [Streptomyces sp.]|nr:hypothetical protein [Streptomyces sp.]